jgi:hypothetical protein
MPRTISGDSEATANTTPGRRADVAPDERSLTGTSTTHRPHHHHEDQNARPAAWRSPWAAGAAKTRHGLPPPSPSLSPRHDPDETPLYKVDSENHLLLKVVNSRFSDIASPAAASPSPYPLLGGRRHPLHSYGTRNALTSPAAGPGTDDDMGRATGTAVAQSSPSPAPPRGHRAVGAVAPPSPDYASPANGRQSGHVRLSSSALFGSGTSPQPSRQEQHALYNDQRRTASAPAGAPRQPAAPAPASPSRRRFGAAVSFAADPSPPAAAAPHGPWNRSTKLTTPLASPDNAPRSRGRSPKSQRELAPSAGVTRHADQPIASASVVVGGLTASPSFAPSPAGIRQATRRHQMANRAGEHDRERLEALEQYVRTSKLFEAEEDARRVLRSQFKVRLARALAEDSFVERARLARLQQRQYRELHGLQSSRRDDDGESPPPRRGERSQRESARRDAPHVSFDPSTSSVLQRSDSNAMMRPSASLDLGAVGSSPLALETAGTAAGRHRTSATREGEAVALAWQRAATDLFEFERWDRATVETEHALDLQFWLVPLNAVQLSCYLERVGIEDEATDELAVIGSKYRNFLIDVVDSASAQRLAYVRESRYQAELAFLQQDEVRHRDRIRGLEHHGRGNLYKAVAEDLYERRKRRDLQAPEDYQDEPMETDDGHELLGHRRGAAGGQDNTAVLTSAYVSAPSTPSAGVASPTPATTSSQTPPREEDQLAPLDAAASRTTPSSHAASSSVSSSRGEDKHTVPRSVPPNNARLSDRHMDQRTEQLQRMVAEEGSGQAASIAVADQPPVAPTAPSSSSRRGSFRAAATLEVTEDDARFAVLSSESKAWAVLLQWEHDRFHALMGQARRRKYLLDDEATARAGSEALQRRRWTDLTLYFRTVLGGAASPGASPRWFGARRYGESDYSSSAANTDRGGPSPLNFTSRTTAEDDASGAQPRRRDIVAPLSPNSVAALGGNGSGGAFDMTPSPERPLEADRVANAGALPLIAPLRGDDDAVSAAASDRHHLLDEHLAMSSAVTPAPPAGHRLGPSVGGTTVPAQTRRPAGYDAAVGWDGEPVQPRQHHLHATGATPSGTRTTVDDSRATPHHPHGFFDSPAAAGYGHSDAASSGWSDARRDAHYDEHDEIVMSSSEGGAHADSPMNRTGGSVDSRRQYGCAAVGGRRHPDAHGGSSERVGRGRAEAHDDGAANVLASGGTTSLSPWSGSRSRPRSASPPRRQPWMPTGRAPRDLLSRRDGGVGSAGDGQVDEEFVEEIRRNADARRYAEGQVRLVGSRDERQRQQSPSYAGRHNGPPKRGSELNRRTQRDEATSPLPQIPPAEFDRTYPPASGGGGGGGWRTPSPVVDAYHPYGATAATGLREGSPGGAMTPSDEPPVHASSAQHPHSHRQAASHSISRSVPEQPVGPVGGSSGGVEIGSSASALPRSSSVPEEELTPLSTARTTTTSTAVGPSRRDGQARTRTPSASPTETTRSTSDHHVQTDTGVQTTFLETNFVPTASSGLPHGGHYHDHHHHRQSHQHEQSHKRMMRDAQTQPVADHATSTEFAELVPAAVAAGSDRRAPRPVAMTSTAVAQRRRLSPSASTASRSDSPTLPRERSRPSPVVSGRRLPRSPPRRPTRDIAVQQTETHDAAVGRSPVTTLDEAVMAFSTHNVRIGTSPTLATPVARRNAGTNVASSHAVETYFAADAGTDTGPMLASHATMTVARRVSRGTGDQLAIAPRRGRDAHYMSPTKSSIAKASRENSTSPGRSGGEGSQGRRRSTSPSATAVHPRSTRSTEALKARRQQQQQSSRTASVDPTRLSASDRLQMFRTKTHQPAVERISSAAGGGGSRLGGWSGGGAGSSSDMPMLRITTVDAPVVRLTKADVGVVIARLHGRPSAGGPGRLHPNHLGVDERSVSPTTDDDAHYTDRIRKHPGTLRQDDAEGDKRWARPVRTAKGIDRDDRWLREQRKHDRALGRTSAPLSAATGITAAATTLRPSSDARFVRGGSASERRREAPRPPDRANHHEDDDDPFAEGRTIALDPAHAAVIASTPSPARHHHSSGPVVTAESTTPPPSPSSPHGSPKLTTRVLAAHERSTGKEQLAERVARQEFRQPPTTAPDTLPADNRNVSEAMMMIEGDATAQLDAVVGDLSRLLNDPSFIDDEPPAATPDREPSAAATAAAATPTPARHEEAPEEESRLLDITPRLQSVHHHHRQVDLSDIAPTPVVSSAAPQSAPATRAVGGAVKRTGGLWPASPDMLRDFATPPTAMRRAAVASLVGPHQHQQQHHSHSNGGAVAAQLPHHHQHSPASGRRSPGADDSHHLWQADATAPPEGQAAAVMASTTVLGASDAFLWDEYRLRERLARFEREARAGLLRAAQLDRDQIEALNDDGDTYLVGGNGGDHSPQQVRDVSGLSATALQPPRERHVDTQARHVAAGETGPSARSLSAAASVATHLQAPAAAGVARRSLLRNVGISRRSSTTRTELDHAPPSTAPAVVTPAPSIDASHASPPGAARPTNRWQRQLSHLYGYQPQL